MEASQMTVLTVEIPDGTSRAKLIRADIWVRPISEGLSSFLILFNNQDGSYNATFSPQNTCDIQADSITLLKGYLDLPESQVYDRESIFTHFLRVSGRGYGQDLNNLYLTKTYDYGTLLDDLIDDALDTAYTGYPDPPGRDVTYTTGGAGPALPGGYEAKRTYLLELIKDLCERENFDAYVANDKALQIVDLSSPPSSGITLKSVAGASDNNILAFKPIEMSRADGGRIYNYIEVLGPKVQDGYTDGTAGDWDADYATLTNETTTKHEGKSSIKAEATGTAEMYVYLDFSSGLYSKTLNYLDWSRYEAESMSWWTRTSSVGSFNCHCRVRLKDTNNQEIECFNNALTPDTWYLLGAYVGPGQIILPASSNIDGQWQYIGASSSFNWLLKEVGFWSVDAGISMDERQTLLIIDDLWLPEDMISIKENAASQVTYRKRMLSINKQYIKYQLELDDYASKILGVTKDPVRKISLQAKGSAGIIGGVNKWLPCNTVTLNIPALGIASETWRMGSIHHAIQPYEDLGGGWDWITDVELVEQNAKWRQSYGDYQGSLDDRIRSLEKK